MTWILLRGLAREAEHWGTFASVLAAALPGERLIALDLPGAGVLQNRRSPVDIGGFVGACRAEAERQGARTPISILALSLGAMVAVAWAHAFPAEVQRCVLLNTSLRPFAPFYRRLRPAIWWSVLRTLAAVEPHARERAVLAMTSARAADKDGVVEAWAVIAYARPVTRANALRQLWAAARYRAPTDRPPCELLLLASRMDRLVDVRCSRAIARAWQVPLVEHDWAGHDLPLDDPRWVADRVREWIGRPA